jgi:hypothetical protein
MSWQRKTRIVSLIPGHIAVKGCWALTRDVCRVDVFAQVQGFSCVDGVHVIVRWYGAPDRVWHARPCASFDRVSPFSERGLPHQLILDHLGSSGVA